MTLIKNAKIIDGSGSSPFTGDLLFHDGKIVAIGQLGKKQADVIVDGRGLILTPGFIDINSSSDHFLSIFADQTQLDFLRQGVTTIICGNDGSSLAPLLYGTLESVRKWGASESVNVDWHSVGEFLSRLSKLHLGVNFGTLIGHSTIRRSLIGEAQRELTITELDVFKKIVEDSLREGAFGLSTGLGYVHAQQTPYHEIHELLQVVANTGGIYATHLRDEEEGLLASIEEVTSLAQETGVQAHINHFRPLLGFEQDYAMAHEMLDKNDPWRSITFDAYPFEVSILPLYKFLPHWAQIGNLGIMDRYLSSVSMREKILKSLLTAQLDSMKIVQAPGNEYLVGELLTAFAQNRNIESSQEALFELMKMLHLRATVFYKNINLEVLEKYFSSPRFFVGSNIASLSSQFYQLQLDRFQRVFPRFLEMVYERDELPLERAIKRITADVAARLRIHDRGLLREGLAADVVLWKLGKRIDVEKVWVNGQLTFSEGKFQNVLPGHVLRKR